MSRAVQPTAKSLILDLLSTMRGEAMPVRALVAAGGLFGIAENGIRVELARLVARELVERNDRGQYRLAGSAAAVQSRVGSWRRSEERMAEWSGRWIGVHTSALGRSPRAAVRRRRRALELLGFGELAPALWVRPDNLIGGVEETRRQLRALGLEADAPVFAMDALDEVSDKRARSLWDTASIRAGYRDMRRVLRKSTRDVPQLSLEEAMAETFLVGGRVLHLLAFDPLLPEAILPGTERRALVVEMRRYDRLGRERWRRFMRTHGALSHESPVNLRVVSGAGDLPAAAGSVR